MQMNLPTAPDAERAVVSEVLATGGEALMRLAFLKPAHFSERTNREIYEASLRIWEAGGKPDEVVLAEVFRDAESPISLDILRGYGAYRGDAASLVDSGRIIRAKWQAREVIRLGEEVSRRGYLEEPEALLDSIAQRATELRLDNESGPKQVLSVEVGELAGVTRLLSGFPALDAYLGGLIPGRLITLASRPGVGKTTLAFDIGSNLAKAGHRVGAFSLEMSQDELSERLILKETKLPSWKFRKPALGPEDVQNVGAALLAMGKWPLYIDDSSGLSPYEIFSKAKALQHEGGLDLVIIDYIQLVSPPKMDSREQEVAAIARAFKHLAKELRVPVLAVSQLSRASEIRGGKPRMSDLRESGGIENDSDQIVVLWDEEQKIYDGVVTFVNVSVVKNRHGATGDFTLGLVKDQSRFESR